MKKFNEFSQTLKERVEEVRSIKAALTQTDVHGNPKFSSPNEVANWVKESFPTEQLGNHTPKAFVFSGAKDFAGPHVIKFCYGDEIYLKFAEFLVNNPGVVEKNTLFPKIEYVHRFPEAGSGVVIMEKLIVANHNEELKKQYEKLAKTTKWFRPNIFQELYAEYIAGKDQFSASDVKMLTFVGINPRMLIEYFALLHHLKAKKLDFNMRLNVARRSNGQFVIFDPLHPNDVA